MSAAIERVVVQLDAACEVRAAVDTAARLAARAKAPLHGVFVEDEDLLNLAALPFARQVTLGAGAERMTRKDAELHLRAAAEAARKELADAAKRHRVKYSFEIVRGGSATALAYASAGDLVVAGGLTRPVAGHFRTEARWWSAVEVASAPMLLVRHGWAASGAVVLLLREKSDSAARLVAAAAQIAHAADGALIVISPPAVAAAKGFQKWLTDRLGGLPVRLTVEIAPAEPAALHRRIGELDCRLLAIEAGFAEGGTDRLRQFVEHFACDILIAG
jgi:nucleotide-binding universal stress UspA family protein